MENSSPSEAPIDRYVVLEYLAEGGMGAIYLGKKMGAGGFEKQVVLKQLLPEFTRQPEFIDLFLREARLSATLDHANIIHTIDLVTAGEDYFIVMEYLDGADLRTLLRRCKRRRRRLSTAGGLYIARELLSALAYAHNKVGPDGVPLRLIHRDISPSNILISGSGEVKLTDFGIAKASTHNSVFYRVKGKVGYMSPEQAKSEPLDARSDLYSLAVCLYEMITSERLFVNVGLTTSADEMYSQPVPLVSHKVQGLPPELDKVMLKALSRDPDHRYQTAGEFQEALLRCAHRHGLMMSAPDLSEHLRHICGETQNWRDDDSENSTVGTELYEMEEGDPTDQMDADEVSFDGDSGMEPASDFDRSIAMASSGQLLPDRDSRRRRARTSITKLTELRGMELTSMINLAGNTDHAGARPLIDFDDLAQGPMLPSTTGTGAGAGGLGAGAGLGAPGPAGAGGAEGFPVPPLARPYSDSTGPQGYPHSLAHPHLHSQASRGSLAHLDPLEETGIIVDPLRHPPANVQIPAFEGLEGLGDTGPVPTVGGFAASGAPSLRPMAPAPSAAGAHPPKGSWAGTAPVQRPLLLLLLIVLVGVGTAAVIGLSGPTVEAASEPRPQVPAGAPASSGPAPSAPAAVSTPIGTTAR